MTVEFDSNRLMNLINIVLVLAVLAMGVIFFFVGLYRLRRAPVSQRFASNYRRRWRLDSSVDDATLRAALRVLVRIRAWQMIFMSPGVFLIAMVWLGISWLVVGNLCIIGVFNGWLLGISALIPIGILGCAGNAYGVYRMRAMAKNHLAYGDLQQRRLCDYAPTWTGCFFIIWFFTLLFMTAMAWNFTLTPLRIRLRFDQLIYLPFGRLGLLAIPLLVALLLVLGIILLRWMIALPRLKSIADIPDIGVFDVYFRRESIFSILLMFAQLMFYAFGIQSWLLIDNMQPWTVLGITLLIAVIGNAIFLFIYNMRLCFDKTIGAFHRNRSSVSS
jgi:hypothetical protein